jgi:hypothetical protein
MKLNCAINHSFYSVDLKVDSQHYSTCTFTPINRYPYLSGGYPIEDGTVSNRACRTCPLNIYKDGFSSDKPLNREGGLDEFINGVAKVPYCIRPRYGDTTPCQLYKLGAFTCSLSHYLNRDMAFNNLLELKNYPKEDYPQLYNANSSIGYALNRLLRKVVEWA